MFDRPSATHRPLCLRVNAARLTYRGAELMFEYKRYYSLLCALLPVPRRIDTISRLADWIPRSTALVRNVRRGMQII